MSVRHPLLLDRRKTVLVAVDLQEPFLRHIPDRERLVANVDLLIRAAGHLDVPVLVTLQYASRMGGVVPEIAAALPAGSAPPCDKMTFSCAGTDAFIEALSSTGRTRVLLCGVETHICVAQTALDLIALGYQVHCAADAVSSRSLERHKLGMEKMRDAGVTPCAAEAAVFELLRDAGAPEFKSIHALVK